jgi:hypothetical protein
MLTNAGWKYQGHPDTEEPRNMLRRGRRSLPLAGNKKEKGGARLSFLLGEAWWDFAI